MAPDTAFLLLIGGSLGIYLEICKPGGILPGVSGSVLLMLGISGFAKHPVQPIGLLLISVGLAVAVFAARSPYFVLAGMAASALLIAGARSFNVSLLAATVGVIPFTIITIVLLSTGFQARKNKAIQEAV